MSEQIKIGSEITFPVLRDYIFEHKVNRGDSIVLNPLNYEHIIDEIRHSHEESIEIPINIFGVLLIKDATGTVETGRIQIIKNETF
ncbi:MAG TPA: hypothetical protein VGB50_10630 [Flavobacterium sp.]